MKASRYSLSTQLIRYLEAKRRILFLEYFVENESQARICWVKFEGGNSVMLLYCNILFLYKLAFMPAALSA